MDELNHKFKSYLALLLLSIVFSVSFSSNVNGEETIFLKKVMIEQAPCLVKLYVTRKVPSKFIKVDKNEVLLALKNVKQKQGLKIIGSKGSLIKSIVLQQLQGNVVAVLIIGNRNFNFTKADYIEAGSYFIINLEKPGLKPAVEIAVKKSTKSDSKKKQYKLIKQKVTKTKSNIVETDIKSQEQLKKPVKTSGKKDTKTKGYIPVKKGKSN